MSLESAKPTILLLDIVCSLKTDHLPLSLRYRSCARLGRKVHEVLSFPAWDERFQLEGLHDLLRAP
jgi:hypothetical protein